MYSFLYLLTFIVFKYFPFLYQKYVWKHLEQRQVCCSGTHLCGMSFLTRVREFMGQILLFACVSSITFLWSKYSWHKSLTYLLATFLSQLQSFLDSITHFCVHTWSILTRFQTLLAEMLTQTMTEPPKIVVETHSCTSLQGLTIIWHTRRWPHVERLVNITFCFVVVFFVDLNVLS